MSFLKKVLVTGGAGYVGSALVPKLLAAGYEVTVLDLYLYSKDVFPGFSEHKSLRQIAGDIRDAAVVTSAVAGQDAIIHLACISNDPSFDLDPALGKSINYDAFRPLVRAAKEAGVQRFINASSSSVYGVKDEPEVTEDLSREPITDYGKFKSMCEDVLAEEKVPEMTTVSVRPASVMGYAPRQRLDLTVNIFTMQAVVNGKLTVFGGDQQRPNVHIDDMTDLYLLLLGVEKEKIDGKVFNLNAGNETVYGIAERVRKVIGKDMEIVRTETTDHRSYRTSGERLRKELGFVPKKTIEDAARELAIAFAQGLLPNPLTDETYYNVKRMKSVDLK
ncbi:NAD-dependent epimerase/dehydratase family protein [Patescibacteria group bacterium]|nr:NAD-dependent epimerase/dehydratase family protein [Patescibacteria group bacterium]